MVLLSLVFTPQRLLLSLFPFLTEAVIYAFVVVGLGLLSHRITSFVFSKNATYNMKK